MSLPQLPAQAARALSLAPVALALAVQLSARVLAVLAVVASAQAAQVPVAHALAELVQAAQVPLMALVQVGFAALGFAALGFAAAVPELALVRPM